MTSTERPTNTSRGRSRITACPDAPDRFLGAAYVDPRAHGARETLSICLDEQGFRAIKLELSEDAGLTGLYPDLRIDDPDLDWLWSEAEAHHAVVTLDLGSIGTRSYQTEAVGKVLTQRPALKVVIAHLAHPPLDEPNDQGLNGRRREQLELGSRHNVWFDLAALPIYATLRTTLTQLYRPTIVKLWTQLEPVGCSGAQMYRGS